MMTSYGTGYLANIMLSISINYYASESMVTGHTMCIILVAPNFIFSIPN